MLELALKLAEQGWYIHPCQPSKRPILDRWHEKSTTEPDYITSWWLRYPDAIPGVHCGPSGLVVFDLEGPEKAHNGATAEQNAEALGLDQYRTLTVRSPSGGLHFYFRGEADGKKLYVDGAFVGDRKAGNGYVIPAGVEGYTVVRGGAVERLTADLLDVGVTSSKRQRFEPRKHVGAGERNDYITAYAGALRRYLEGGMLLRAVQLHNRETCDPPLTDDEVQAIVDSVHRYPMDGPDSLRPSKVPKREPASTEPRPFEETYARTDLGNSQRFVARWGHALRYVHHWGRWIIWDGMRWRPDENGQAERWMVETLRQAAQSEAALLADQEDRERLVGWLTLSESRRRLDDALKLASTAPGMHVTPDDLDAKPDLLNAPNGMVDLRTGALLPHDPDALATKVTNVAYDPDARSERFEDFLEEVWPDRMDIGAITEEGGLFLEGEEMRGYAQRCFGYTLTGAPEREQVLFIHYGATASGKSTLIEAVGQALGEYRKPADVEAVLTRKRGQHPHDLATLRGARLVDTSELDSGEKLSESIVKRVTAGEPLNARFMRQNLFTYVPTWVLHVTTNHGFTFGAGGASVERRLAVIPWTISFLGKHADKKLRQTLKEQGEAILAWMVQGAVEYHHRGGDLAPPDVALAVKADLAKGADPLRAFIADAVDFTGDPKDYASTEALYEGFRTWWTKMGRDGTPDYDKAGFSRALNAVEGVPKSSNKNVAGSVIKVRKGLRLKGEYAA